MDIEATIKHGERLAENVKLAELITLSYELNLDILREQARELSTSLGVMPIVEPARWFAERHMWEATLAVLKAGIAFAEVTNKVRVK